MLAAVVAPLLLVAAAAVEVEEDRSEGVPDMAKGLLSSATPAPEAPGFFDPATSASKLTRAELAPRKSSGDLLGLLPPWAGEPLALPPTAIDE